MKRFLIILLCCLLSSYCQAQTTRIDSATAKPDPSFHYRMYPLALVLARLGLGVEIRKSPKRSFVLDGFYLGRHAGMDDIMDFQPGGEIRADYRIYRHEEKKRMRLFVGPGMDFRMQRYTMDVYDDEFHYYPSSGIQKWRQRVGIYGKAGYEYRFRREGKLLLEGYATFGVLYQSVIENVNSYRLNDVDIQKYEYNYNSVQPHVSIGIVLKL